MSKIKQMNRDMKSGLTKVVNNIVKMQKYNINFNVTTHLTFLSLKACFKTH
jgi:hypothetical protein